MKGFLVLALCIVTVTANVIVDTFFKCAKKEGVIIPDKDILYDSLMNGGDPPRKIKCFLSCVAENQEILVEGAYNGHAAKKYLSNFPRNPRNDDRILNVLDDCSKQMKSNDQCDRIWELAKCAGPTIAPNFADNSKSSFPNLGFKEFF